ncbi:hypothetical protein ASF09_19050 [Sphingomonas sp. Leaf242]|nr:hypothetical protein ASF09_19050 [Sphingomonas sp. Leaf242]
MDDGAFRVATDFWNTHRIDEGFSNVLAGSRRMHCGSRSGIIICNRIAFGKFALELRAHRQQIRAICISTGIVSINFFVAVDL